MTFADMGQPKAHYWERDPATGEESVSIPDVCGAFWWAQLHSWAQNIHDVGCSSCGEFAIAAAHAIHDTVSAKLGKPIEDSGHLLEVYQAMGHALKGAGVKVEQASSEWSDVQWWEWLQGDETLEELFQREKAMDDILSLGGISYGTEEAPSIHSGASVDKGGVRPAIPQPSNARGHRRPSVSRRSGDGEGRPGKAQAAVQGAPGLASAQPAGEPVFLDTTVLSVVTILNHDLAPFYALFLQGRPVVTSLIAVAENLGSVHRLTERQLEHFHVALADVPRLQLREDVALFWAKIRLRARRRSISDHDVWMAAFAMAYDIPLVTDDRDLALDLNGEIVEGRTLRIFSRHLNNLAQAGQEAVLSGAFIDTVIGSLASGLGFGVGGFLVDRTLLSRPGPDVHPDLVIPQEDDPPGIQDDELPDELVDLDDLDDVDDETVLAGGPQPGDQIQADLGPLLEDLDRMLSDPANLEVVYA